MQGTISSQGTKSNILSYLDLQLLIPRIHIDLSTHLCRHAFRLAETWICVKNKSIEFVFTLYNIFNIQTLIFMFYILAHNCVNRILYSDLWARFQNEWMLCNCYWIIKTVLWFCFSISALLIHYFMFWH